MGNQLSRPHDPWLVDSGQHLVAQIVSSVCVKVCNVIVIYFG